LQWGLNC